MNQKNTVKLYLEMVCIHYIELYIRKQITRLKKQTNQHTWGRDGNLYDQMNKIR